MMPAPLLSVELRLEHDVVLGRQRARQIAASFGFDQQDQTRIATAVSELARNAYQYGGGGRIEFDTDPRPPASLIVRVIDHGPGIRDLDEVLQGRYHSSTGLGLGILGARRLMDSFEVRSSAEEGTLVQVGKHLPKRAAGTLAELRSHVVDALAKQRPTDPLEEIQQQNQELLRTLNEVRSQRERLAQLNRELEETNRGVVALYAELDERADYLQRANEVKTRFLSNMTHEFRTPLNSIISLTRLLLDRLDGDLTTEQEKQIRFIQQSADNLTELVNDLLDLAKVEAGKIVVRPGTFRVSDLFGTLRGMLRPLLAQSARVELVFEEPPDLPPMNTDESKVSQILRNFISNALKYTEKGEVRVRAQRDEGDTVLFEVIDTGIGVADQDITEIFREFTQVENPLQRRVRGTGLGLPLSRRLATLLGGSVGVRSKLGVGSTFYAVIPAEFHGPKEVVLVPEVTREIDPTRLPVLVVEDNRESLFIYEKYLKGTGYQVLPARTLKEARDWLRTVRPVAIILDILLETEHSWGFLSELRERSESERVPVLVITMVENETRARALGADEFHVKPVDRSWLLSRLAELARTRPHEKIIVIDDDDVSRYLLRGLLADTRFSMIEAGSGREGLVLAREHRPAGIFLDLVMPEMDGFTVLNELKKDPTTRDIPVFIYTSRRLTEQDRSRLYAAAAIIPKESPSRDAALTTIRSALLQAGLVDERPSDE